MDIFKLQLIGILISGFIFVSAVLMPWINYNRIIALRKDIKRLAAIVHGLTKILEENNIKIPDALKVILSSPMAQPSKTYQPIMPVKKKGKAEKIELKTTPTPIAKDQTTSALKFMQNFEQQFAVRLSVWLGGIALALAGFFLVKYSIENNLFTPLYRVITGGFMGVALVVAADWLNKKPDLANGRRITQALNGAGIIIFYVSIFAATSFYKLLEARIGFIGMATVTAVAVIYSLRYGWPVALFGLVGGFLTPALIGTEAPSVIILFTYLYFVFIGVLMVTTYKNWWFLNVPALSCVFIWTILWFRVAFSSDEILSLGLFLLAIFSVMVMATKLSYDRHKPKGFNLIEVCNIASITGVGILMGVLIVLGGFGVIEWLIFAAFSCGTLVAAAIDQRRYRFAPWVALVVGAVALFIWWRNFDSVWFAVTLVGLALLQTVVGGFLLHRSKRPIFWAVFISIAAIGYYILAYLKLRYEGLFDHLPLFWGLVALGLSGIAVYIVQNLPANIWSFQQRQHLRAIFSVTATAFISLALTVELEREFLSVAFAVEMFAIAWVNSRANIKVLRLVSLVLAIIFAVLLLPQIFLLLRLAIFSLIEVEIAQNTIIPIVRWPSFQLGIPAVMFLATAYYLQQQRDGLAVQMLEVAAIGLIAIMGYYLLRHAFNAEAAILSMKASFVERGVMTNIFFAFAFLCLLVGWYFDRVAFLYSGIGLAALAIFRIIYFDLLLYNPLWSEEKISGWSIFNALLLPYGFSIVWLALMAKELQRINFERLALLTFGFIPFLLFVLVTLNTRYFFQGEYLNGGLAREAELYSYSAVWLALGFCLLLYAIVKHVWSLRLMSLALVLLSVGKVFLYDAGELEGLYRAASFFGLGLSLLVISWLYVRFVFIKNKISNQ